MSVALTSSLELSTEYVVTAKSRVKSLAQIIRTAVTAKQVSKSEKRSINKINENCFNFHA